MTTTISATAPTFGHPPTGWFREGRQLCLFDTPATVAQLGNRLWCESFEPQASSLHQLAPYATKLRSGLVQVLIDLYSQPGDIVLDPFAGSGTVPLETVLAERQAWAIDVSPYACAVTRAKLAAPRSERLAVQRVVESVGAIETTAATVDLNQVPAWIHPFFHPETLREAVAAFEQLRDPADPFLTGCLLGILHHVLPGHLSYPTNQHAPYLRRATYPPDELPHLYGYRDVRSRLLAKIKRLYRQHRLPPTWEQRQFQVWQASCLQLPIADATVDTIISQPPHRGAIESLRDQRLRLWFLGHADWQTWNADLIPATKAAEKQWELTFQEFARVLKPSGYCILILNDVQQHGTCRGIAEQFARWAAPAPFTVETIYDQERSPRSRSPLKAVKFQRLLILRKQFI